MFHHRFAELLPSEPPSGAVTTAAVGAFVMCPTVLQPATMAGCLMWHQVLERAFREALAVVRPSRLERLQAVGVN